MKLRIITTAFVMMILFIFSSAFAQQGDQAEMMKKWQEYMTPGPAQQSFAKMAGAWKAEVTIFDPSGKEMKSDGTADYEMILGGRYLKSNFKGTMMGMPMEGMGLDAYDNATKEYISVWIDNFGTGVIYMKGKWEDATQTIVYQGSATDPMTGKDQPMKTVIKTVDDKHFQMLMFNIDGDKEVKTMQIDYTRS
ncbi:MAG: DUF1579 domain-containing protein [Bacteroidetes bacterium]|nr:DUF1579 domain-containing protein [Bacteroidota bacterium]